MTAVKTYDTRAEGVVVRRGHGPVHIAIPGIILDGRKRHADPTRYRAACGREITGPRIAVWRRTMAARIWAEWRHCRGCEIADGHANDHTDAGLRRYAQWWAA